MKDNKQLQLAYDFVLSTGTSIFLTGKAGTGKSTFLRRIRKEIPKRSVVLAPTGVAAINVEGVTVHSFFQLPFCPYIPGMNYKEEDTYKYTAEKLKIIRSVDLIIIDEISMVRPDILDAMDSILRKYRRNEAPFGGVQLLMIGDLQQLAPVIKDDDWSVLKPYYPTPYFFSSMALQRMNYVCIALTEIFRQNDPEFIGILDKIRDKSLDDETIDIINRQYKPDFIPDDKDGYITLTTHNATAKKINEEKLAAIDDEEFTFDAQIDGEFPENSFPTDRTLILKKNAQVMFIKNDVGADRRYYNGKIGIITDIDSKSVTITCPDNNKPIVVKPVQWKNVRYKVDRKTNAISEEEIGSFEQMPLKLAWAITIHKSQGLTFDKVIINAQAAFAHGQVYVAFSRCRSLKDIVLHSPISKNMIFDDYYVDLFTNEIHNNQVDNQKLELFQQQYYMQLLSELFDFEQLRDSLSMLSVQIKVNFGKSYPKLSEDYTNAVKEFDKDIIEVAHRFMLLIPTLSRDNDAFHQKIKNGASYFRGKMEDIVKNLIDNTNVETDSKENKQKFNEIYERCYKEWYVKDAVLQTTADNGLNTVEYLDVRANAILEADKLSKAKLRKRDGSASSDIQNMRLFMTLKEWREAEASIHDVEPHVILQYKSLVDLANKLPSTKKELLSIAGIGKVKAAKYGDEILEIIEEWKSYRRDQ